MNLGRGTMHAWVQYSAHGDGALEVGMVAEIRWEAGEVSSHQAQTSPTVGVRNVCNRDRSWSYHPASFRPKVLHRGE
jgi:hypothetical protein